MQQRAYFRNMKIFAISIATIYASLNSAVAQPPKNTFGSNQRGRPTISPFVSMVDTGNGVSDGGTGLNYFNIVRPVQQGRTANKNLQKELRSFEATTENNFGGGRGLSGSRSATTAITTGRLPETGHLASFSDLGGRFGTGSGIGGAARGGGGGGGGRRNNFGNQPSGGLGIANNLTGGNATPNGILGGR